MSPSDDGNKRFEESAAIATGALSAALALVDPLTGVVAAGLAPFVANRLSELHERRMRVAIEQLNRTGVDTAKALGDDPNSPLKCDLLREYLVSASETSSAEKVRLLVHLMDFGLSTQTRLEVLYARRAIRTVARIDELELVVLAALAVSDSHPKGVTVVDLAATAGISDTNLVRSVLAVLAAEGLVAESTRDAFRVSDYGAILLKELRQAQQAPLPRL